MGENETFVGGESILKDHGVEVVNLNLDSCKNLMNKVRLYSSVSFLLTLLMLGTSNRSSSSFIQMCGTR